MIDTGSFLLCLLRFFLSRSRTCCCSGLPLPFARCLSVSVSLSCLVSMLVNETHIEVTCCSSVSINPGFLKKVFSVSHSIFLLPSCRWRLVRLHQCQAEKRLGISRDHWSFYFTDTSILLSLSLSFTDPVNQSTISHRGCVCSRLVWLFFDSSDLSNQRARFRTELTLNY